MKEHVLYLAKLIGAVVFAVTVLGVGSFFAQMPDDKAWLAVNPDRRELVRLQPAAMAEATYQINAEIERRFKHEP